MSTEQDKFKHSKRLHQDENAIKKQTKIAKQHGVKPNDASLREPHRMNKHHVMDCGNPECGLCGNPRHIHKDGLTAQEKRLFQDVDKITDRHSNGLSPTDEDISS